MCFIVYDEDFCCDWFVGWKCESSLVVWLLLAVRYLLICSVRYELKYLQVVFPLDFHAVNTVPDYYLGDERHRACYARTPKIPEAFTPRGNFCVPKIIRIAYAATWR